MRFEFENNQSIASLLTKHGTRLEIFTDPAIKAISESLVMSKSLGKNYASVDDLLLRLSLSGEQTEERTRDIMSRFNLTTESIMSVIEPNDENIGRIERVKGTEMDYRIMLVSLDHFANLYPGLPKTPDMKFSQLDLLYNSVMWTKDSAAKVFSSLRTNPVDVVNACRAERWNTIETTSY